MFNVLALLGNMPAFSPSVYQVHHRIQLPCSSCQESAMAWLTNQPTIQCSPKLPHPLPQDSTPLGHTSLFPQLTPINQAHSSLLTLPLQASLCCPGLWWEVLHPTHPLSLPAPALVPGCPQHKPHHLLLLCLLLATTQTLNSPCLQHGSTTQLPHQWGQPLLWARIPEALWQITWIQLQAWLHHHHRHLQLTALHQHHTAPPNSQAPESHPPLCMDTLSQVGTQRLY